MSRRCRFSRRSRRPSDAAVLIGPEGGWTEEECAAAHQRGVRLVTLGQRTLRADAIAGRGDQRAAVSVGRSLTATGRSVRAHPGVNAAHVVVTPGSSSSGSVLCPGKIRPAGSVGTTPRMRVSA